MKIGIISDSHDNLDKLRLAVKKLSEQKISYLIHLGDYVAPFTIPIIGELRVKCYGVLGNNDGEVLVLVKQFNKIGELRKGPFEVIIENKKFLLMHEPFCEMMENFEYDVVLYGHTHKAETRKGKALVINPGECCGWLFGVASCAVLDLIEMRCEIIRF